MSTMECCHCGLPYMPSKQDLWVWDRQGCAFCSDTCRERERIHEMLDRADIPRSDAARDKLIESWRRDSGEAP